jgi:chemotaxis protein MotB
MMIPRALLLVPLAGALVLGGCARGGGSGHADPSVVEKAQADEIKSLQGQVDSDNAQITDLKAKLAAALANQKDSGGDVGGIVQSISGGPVDGFVDTGTGGVALPDDFAFAKGSDALNDEGVKAVARLAERLNQGDNAGKKVTVKGFTDSTPVEHAATKEKFTDNWGLSAARSAAVLRALAKGGVAEDRLVGAFRGQLDPRDTGDSADAKAKNRRVEIYLSK